MIHDFLLSSLADALMDFDVEKQGFVDQCVREIRGVRLVHVLHIKLLKIELQAI